MASSSFPHTFGKYRFISKLAEGASSTVILAKNTVDEQLYACKFISKENYSHNKQSIDNEISILKSVSHPNIVSYIETIWHEQFLIIVTEYLSGDSLVNYIMKYSKLTADDVLKISAQLLSALQYLHSLGICHRDIKPDNIVFDHLMRPKLLDFGFAVKLPLNKITYLTDRCGTLEFVAPEILLQQPYSGYAADMWSFGVTVYAMSVGLFPWPNNTDNNVLAKAIAYGSITIPTELHDVVKYVITKTLNRKPNERPTAYELLRLPQIQRHLVSNSLVNNAHSLNRVHKLIKPTASAFGPKCAHPKIPKGKRSSMISALKNQVPTQKSVIQMRTRI